MEQLNTQALTPEHRHWIGMRIIKTVVAVLDRKSVRPACLFPRGLRLLLHDCRRGVHPKLRRQNH